MGTEQEWPRMLPMKVYWKYQDYQDYWPESRMREELETAWLRGYAGGVGNAGDDLNHSIHAERELEAADYAERVVGGSTRPERPEVGR